MRGDRQAPGCVRRTDTNCVLVTLCACVPHLPNGHYGAVGGRWAGSRCKSLKPGLLPKLIKLVSLRWSHIAPQHNIFDPDSAFVCVSEMVQCAFVYACECVITCPRPKESTACANKTSASHILDFFNVYVATLKYIIISLHCDRNCRVWLERKFLPII